MTPVGLEPGITSAKGLYPEQFRPRGHVNCLKICDSWVYFFGWQGGTWTPRDRKASWFTVSAATNYGIPANIGRCDGNRTHTDIYPTASETAPYTSFGTHRKNYNTFYIIHSTPNECQCQAFLKSYLKKRIITFEHLKLRFSGVALCQKHRKRPLVSWITRSKRP